MPSPGPARRLVLASRSPARLGLLRAAGLDPEVVVSGVDEDAVTAPTTAELVLALARAKAGSVAATLGPAAAGVPGGTAPLVLGCDSLLDLDGAPLGKPADAGEARRRWAAMAGRTGVLHTGHCLLDLATGREAAAVRATTVRFGRPDPAELEAYLASGEPLEVAGAFTLDGLAGPFVEGIEGDPSNVVGLSLPTLRRLLGEHGLRVTDLWRAGVRGS